jgi:hypothetical protein
MERVSRSFSPFRNYLNPTGEVAEENVPIIDLGDEVAECRATDGSTVRQPSLPQYVLERFSRSFTPLRNYLNSLDNMPRLDLDDEDPDRVSFWGEDGRRVDSLLSAGEEDDEEDESSSDESVDGDEDDEEDEEDGEAAAKKRKDFDLPWKP